MSEGNSYTITTQNGDRKFIGGAAAARLNAKKKTRSRGTRILRPDEVLKSREMLSSSLSPFERFFAAILRSEPTEFVRGNAHDVWNTICNRLGLPIPKAPLPDYYSTQKAHFANRASLVMEESRQTVEDGLRLLTKSYTDNSRRSNQQQSDNNPSRHNLTSMDVVLVSAEHKEKSGHSILTFHKEIGSLTKDELLSLRHGTVFGCLNLKLTTNVENTVLGAILPQSRDEMIESQSFSVMVFKLMKKKTTEERWRVTAITSLLSEQRKYEACTNQMTASLPFIFSLLGGKKATHLRFHEDDSGNTYTVDQQSQNSEDDWDTPEVIDLNSTFCLPRLNGMQEKAASAFLASKEDSITICQGPPGTGKTTLLTSVICRYIMESQKLEHTKRCLMVCAPTNKAITVLCSRFLDSITDDEMCPCNAVLIGDDDKLLDDDSHGRRYVGGAPSKLRSIFLYTFVDTIEADYLFMKKSSTMKNLNNTTLQKTKKIARCLMNRLNATIKEKQVLDAAARIARIADKLSISSTQTQLLELRTVLESILAAIRAWKRENIWQELLGNADVIFCTLASAGTSFMKKAVSDVDDLIVDEAAAATEPEMYIPFQYRPRRLLAVGDPKQLPATVTSQIAEDLGLSKSLHERLMYGCGYDHIMLDTQYRMAPALSQFPSRQFYDGKLINAGNVVSSHYVNSSKVMGAPVYTVFQINGKERQAHSGSMENELEARAVVNIVETIKKESRKFTGNWCASNRLRVITFYQAQVALIKRLLRQRNLGEVLVATVDSSQGCEADLVIVSFVRSNGQGGRNSVGFLTDDRRLNVSITRAKYQMMILGNIQRMSELPDGKADTVKLLALDALERKCVLPFPFDGEQVRIQENDLNQNNVQMERKMPSECLEPSVKGPRKRIHDQRIEPRKRMLPSGSLAATETVSTAGDIQRALVDERKVSSKSKITIDLCSSSSSGSSSSGDSSDSDSSSSSSTSTGGSSSTELSIVESRVQSVMLKAATQSVVSVKPIPSFLYVNHKSDPDSTCLAHECKALDVSESSGGEPHSQFENSPVCDPPGLYSDAHHRQNDKTVSQNDPEIIYLSSSSD